MPRKPKPETEPPVSEPAPRIHARQPKPAGVRKAAAKPRARKALAVAPATAPQRLGITHEEIARLAYSFWEARQSPHASADDDWYRAERELRAMMGPGG